MPSDRVGRPRKHPGFYWSHHTNLHPPGSSQWLPFCLNGSGFRMYFNSLLYRNILKDVRQWLFRYVPDPQKNYEKSAECPILLATPKNVSRTKWKIWKYSITRTLRWKAKLKFDEMWMGDRDQPIPSAWMFSEKWLSAFWTNPRTCASLTRNFFSGEQCLRGEATVSPNVEIRREKGLLSHE